MKVVLLCLALCVALAAAQTTCDAVCTPSSDGSAVCNARGACNVKAGEIDGTCVCADPYVSTIDATANCMACNGCLQGFRPVPREGSTLVECVADTINNTACDISPCGIHGGVCTPVEGTVSDFQCTCQAGYISDGVNTGCNLCAAGYVLLNEECVLSADPCNPNPCQDDVNAMCFALNGAIGCRCKDGYIIDSRTGLCAPKPIDCTNVQCPNGGTCVIASASSTGYTCECPPGWRNIIEVIISADGVHTEHVRYCSACDTEAGYTPVYSGSSATNLVLLNCTKPVDPCESIQCQNDGRCYVDNLGNPQCACPFYFAGDLCEGCAQGYIDAPATVGTPTGTSDTFSGRCRACAQGYHLEGVQCVPNSNTGCEGKCNHGDCVTTLIATTGTTTTSCSCWPGFTHNPETGAPCSICKDVTLDVEKNCTALPPNNYGFDECTKRCRAAYNDPNAICIVTRVPTADGQWTIKYDCGCDYRYRKDAKGRCTLCAEGYFPSSYNTNGFPICTIPRCPGGCNKGECVRTSELDANKLPIFACKCPDGWTGAHCETPAPPSNASVGCFPACVAPQRCAKFEVRSVTDYNLVGADAPITIIYKCTCPPNFVDFVDPATGAVKPCAVCAAGFSGPDCMTPVYTDDVLCARLNCPEHTKCRVFSPEGQTFQKAACFCPDGSMWSDSNKCDRPTELPAPNPCALILCIANSECVPSSDLLGASCVCRRGYILSTDASGNRACIPITPECPIVCPQDQVCATVLDYSSATISKAPRCVCKNPRTHWVEGKCVCNKEWTGEFCHIPVNPCDLYGEKCPRGTKCVPHRESNTGGFRCVCAGSWTGDNCTVDLCHEKNCDYSKGYICDDNGQCSCPFSRIIADGMCKPRPIVDTPPSVILRDDCTNSDATKPCFTAPPDRVVTVEGSNSDVTVTAEGGDATKVDRFIVEAFGHGQLSVCVRRLLGIKDSTEHIDVAMRFCFKLLKIWVEEVAIGEAIDSTNFVAGTAVEIGKPHSDPKINTTVVARHDVKTDDNGKDVEIVLQTEDSIVQVVCYVTEKPRTKEGAGLRPSSTKCGLIFRVPPTFYRAENSRICFSGDISIPDANTASIRANTNAGVATINVFPKNEKGETVQSLGSLTLDTFAMVGASKFSVKYSVTADSDGLVRAKACILTANPDYIYIDPEFSSDDSSYSQGAVTPAPTGGNTPSSAATSTVSMIVLVATALLAFFL